MSIKIVEDNFDKKEWNSTAPHPLQSWEWGEAREKMELEVVRMGEFSGHELKNTFQMTLHNLPLGQKIGYLPRSKYPSRDVVNFLTDYGKKNNLIFIKLEPYEEFRSQLTVHSSPLALSQHPLFPEWTMTVDLLRSEEELLKNMKPKTRYNIRLAQKKGVVVKEMTDEKGFEIFQKLYFETCRRQSFRGHNYDYHKAVFDTLKGDIAHILVAFYDNTPLAAYEVFVFNDILYYTYGGSSEAHRNLMPTNLLMWETMRLGKKMGAKTFDMWNTLPPEYDPTHEWAGFTRFKEGFGGQRLHLAPSMDLVINPIFYSLYNLIYKAREVYLSR